MATTAEPQELGATEDPKRLLAAIESPYHHHRLGWPQSTKPDLVYTHRGIEHGHGAGLKWPLMK